MTIEHTDAPTCRKPLRLWPGVAAVVLSWVAMLILPIVVPGNAFLGIFAGVAGGLMVLVWWLIFSRAPWAERIGAIVLMVAAVFATYRVVHESIANGLMGRMVPIFSIPVLSLALVLWAVVSNRLSVGPRSASLVAAIVLGCGVFTLVRTGGITGDASSDFHWRWTPTPEERLLAQAADEPAVSPPAPSAVAPAPTLEPKKQPVAEAAETRAIWPGFRGPDRDSAVRAVRIETDWSKSPPVELWRRPIGPGWSSFAVRRNLVYTQEQRGENELVACYNATTGKPVWIHRDAARFWESNGGAGPRGTPTLSNGRVYTFGATGIVNALDAGTGAVVWSRNAAADTGKKILSWGFTSSPLVVDDVVIVAASGRLIAYDAATGKQRWLGKNQGASYSSPHLMTISGVPQIVLLSGTGISSVAPADGTLLWEHRWEGVPIVQPAQIADGDVLVSTSDMAGLGTRRLAVAHGQDGWTVEQRWTSNGLKPYFNDYVVHKGHAFGFGGNILASIDLEDGKRKWKGGR